MGWLLHSSQLFKIEKSFWPRFLFSKKIDTYDDLSVLMLSYIKIKYVFVLQLNDSYNGL